MPHAGEQQSEARACTAGTNNDCVVHDIPPRLTTRNLRLDDAAEKTKQPNTSFGNPNDAMLAADRDREPRWIPSKGFLYSLQSQKPAASQQRQRSWVVPNPPSALRFRDLRKGSARGSSGALPAL